MFGNKNQVKNCKITIFKDNLLTKLAILQYNNDYKLYYYNLNKKSGRNSVCKLNLLPQGVAYAKPN
jgi:hypothetical protein